MRFEGDIEYIENIEQIICDQTGYALLKDEALNPPCGKEHCPTLFTKLYCIFINPYTFDVRLLFDYRKKTGRFDLKDVNSQLLFVKVPDIPRELSKLNKMLMSKRNGTGYEVREIPLHLDK